MSVAREPVRFTYEDYKLLPEEKRVELIDGNFLMTPAPRTGHQEISGRIYRLLADWVGKCHLGKVYYAPVDVVFSEHDVVQPDLLFIAKEHLKIVKEANVQGPPDLVIEILSPGTEKRDTEIKRKLYSKFGVREYWIVDPTAETVTLLLFEENQLSVKQSYPAGSFLESQVVAGFKLPVQSVFASNV